MSAGCPNCGHFEAAPAPAPQAEGTTLDLEALVAAAERERAYDESVRVRVTQQDIRKLVERRRRKA